MATENLWRGVDSAGAALSPPSDFCRTFMETTTNSDLNQTRPNTSARRKLVFWAVGAVAIVMLVVFMLVSWWIFVRIREATSPPAPVTDTGGPAPALAPAPALTTDNAQANWSRPVFTLKAADGLRQTSASAWSVKGGRAFMQVRRLEDVALEFRFVYPFDELLPQETNALLRTRWSLGSTDALVGQLNISPEQLGDLEAVSPATDIPVTSADRRELSILFNDYLSATDKSVAEKTLVEAVVALDAKYYDRTMQTVENIAGQVRQIFTEEQWAGLSKRFGMSPRPLGR